MTGDDKGLRVASETDMKKCSKCKCVKQRSEFSSDKSRADFLNNKCKACDKRTKDSRYHEDDVRHPRWKEN